jgi:carbonic anhydrase
MIDKFIEGNKRFITEDFEQDKEHYDQLSQSQSPSVLWIGCSDSRVAPERVTGAKSGEIFVHRNIGNIVPVSDWNFATVLEYAIRHLKVDDIVVCGHSDCGAIKALSGKAGDDAYIPLWLDNAKPAMERAGEKPDTPEGEKEWRRKVEYENVKLQLEHLRVYPIVKWAEKMGKVELHGLYFDLETGELSEIF